MKPQTPAHKAIDVVEEELHRIEIDSFYLTKCEWPKVLKKPEGEDYTPKDALYQLEEIMGKYEPCYIRHNGLVEVLQK